MRLYIRNPLRRKTCTGRPQQGNEAGIAPVKNMLLSRSSSTNIPDLSPFKPLSPYTERTKHVERLVRPQNVLPSRDIFSNPPDSVVTTDHNKRG